MSLELVELGKLEFKKYKKEDLEKELKELFELRDKVKKILDKLGPKAPLEVRRKFEELEKEYQKLFSKGLGAAPVAIAAGTAALVTAAGITYHILKVRKLKSEYANLYKIVQKYVDYLPEEAKKEIIQKTNAPEGTTKDVSQILTAFVIFLVGFLALQYIRELRK